MSVSSKFDLGNAFVTSPLIPTKALACIRLILAFYTLFTLIYSLAYEGAGSWFSYFTHLTYIGMCSWFWASGVQTATWAFRKKGGQRKYLLRTWPRALQLAHEWLWSTVASFPVIVTVVYWVLLGASFDGPVKTWSTISMHAFNTLFCLFEVVFTNNPAPRWIWLPVDIVVLALYLGLAYLSKKTIGFYVYDFLDPKEQGALLAAYIIGIGVAEVLLFSIMYGLIRLRQRLTKSKRAVEGAAEADEDKSSSQQHEEKLGSLAV